MKDDHQQIGTTTTTRRERLRQAQPRATVWEERNGRGEVREERIGVVVPVSESREGNEKIKPNKKFVTIRACLVDCNRQWNVIIIPRV